MAKDKDHEVDDEGADPTDRIAELFDDEKLEELLDTTLGDVPEKEALKRAVAIGLRHFITETHVRNKLEIMFSYERHHLDLVKQHSEQIKFVKAVQEDLRREEAQFFTNVLGEVAQTLRDSQVPGDVASEWIQDLVQSYTQSIRRSGELVESRSADVIGRIRQQAASILHGSSRAKPRGDRKPTKGADEVAEPTGGD